METIYLVGIVAGVIGVVIIVVVWLLRDRITGGHFRGSVPQQEIELELKASSPRNRSETPASPAGGTNRPAAVDISGNWLVGTNTIRVLRDKARVSFNRLLGRNRIEVGPEPPPAVAKPKKQGRKK